MNAFAVLAISALAALASATDPCDPKVCTVAPYPTKPHVACGFTGQAKPKCTGAIQPTDAQKQLILDAHNKLRQKIASGNEPGFKPAARMTTMKWHDELAYFALVNALNCDFEHDECHNTDKWKYTGQNLAQRGSTGDYPEVNWALEDSVNGWYAEVSDATQNDIDKFGDSPKVIGHFTQVVNALADYVGCGGSKYKYTGDDGTVFNGVQVSCNYPRTNIDGQAIYETGKPGSKCKTGTNPKYPALCSEAEEIDSNYIKW